jgi:hypothetical protein
LSISPVSPPVKIDRKIDRHRFQVAVGHSDYPGMIATPEQSWNLGCSLKTIDLVSIPI